MSRIFISYKRADRDKVFKIKDQIEAALGEKCWIDIDGIGSDSQFENVIIKAIKAAQIVLFMYSNTHYQIENAIQTEEEEERFRSDWTMRELNFAEKKHKRVVFINVDGSPLSDRFDFRYGTKQQVDATSPAAMRHLISDLKRWLHIAGPVLERSHPTAPKAEKSTEKSTASSGEVANIVSAQGIEEQSGGQSTDCTNRSSQNAASKSAVNEQPEPNLTPVRPAPRTTYSKRHLKLASKVQIIGLSIVCCVCLGLLLAGVESTRAAILMPDLLIMASIIGMIWSTTKLPNHTLYRWSFLVWDAIALVSLCKLCSNYYEASVYYNLNRMGFLFRKIRDVGYCCENNVSLFYLVFGAAYVLHNLCVLAVMYSRILWNKIPRRR